MAEYEPLVGLEVHAQLRTQSKMFCGCSTAYGAAPNTQVCPVCLGLPGALPSLNAKAIELGLRVAIAAGSRINSTSLFARKSYFYPDLPKGYQISQHVSPLCEGGAIQVQHLERELEVPLERLHLEEDAGKSKHVQVLGEGATLVDMNRCGVPLLEIVSKPVVTSPGEAVSYLEALRQLMDYLDVCDGDMEKGSLRCDVNVSVRPKGAAAMGVRTEVKNLNSFKAVEKALHFEIERQTRLMSSGGRVDKETLLWDEQSESCLPMRSKEEAHDYRYFPEPDLRPLRVPPELIERVAQSLPELPHVRRVRLRDAYAIPAYDAGVLTSRKTFADYFEACVATGAEPKVASNWIMTEVKRHLKEDPRTVAGFPVPPESLAELVGLIDDGTVSGKIAKTVYEEMTSTGEKAGAVIERLGLIQISDRAIIQETVDGILKKERRAVLQYQEGRVEALEYLIGAVMKATGEKGNPSLVREILRKRLDSPLKGGASD